jgi:aspartate aminotransferase
MKAKGIDIVDLSLGEPDFETAQHIKDAAFEAMNEGYTKYTAVGGADDIKDAIIDKFKRVNGIEYKRSEVIVSCGGKHALYNLAQALFQEGDEVIVPSPYWVSYPSIVSLSGATPVILPTTEHEGFKLSAELLANCIKSKTRALIINSPSNPTGAVYKRGELEKIAKVAVEKEIYLISDDLYENFIYDDVKFISLASLGADVKKQTIVINGVSKGYAMTGWRIGYACGPEEIISAMTRIQSQSTSNPNSIAQKAAIEALTGSQAEAEAMVVELDKRRRRIVELLNQIDGINCSSPDGAFYVFPNVSNFLNQSYDGRFLSSALDLTKFLLEKAKVAIMPGEVFGAPEHIRIHYSASMKDIETGIGRINKALSHISA